MTSRTWGRENWVKEHFVTVINPREPFNIVNGAIGIGASASPLQIELL